MKKVVVLSFLVVTLVADLSRYLKAFATQTTTSGRNNVKNYCRKLIGLAVVGVALGSFGQTIQNGSFELPGHGQLPDPTALVYPLSDGVRFGGWTAWFKEMPAGDSGIAGWAVGGGGIDYFVNCGPLISWPSASEGEYFIDLVQNSSGQGGSVSQLVTGLQAGISYYVFFDVYQGGLSAGTTITAKGGSVTRAILNTIPERWQTHSLKFTATNASTTVSFATPATGALNISVYLDNVRISTLSNAPVTLAPKKFLGVSVGGVLGKTYRIEYSDSLPAASWTFFTRVTLTNNPTWVYDEITPISAKRFYRSVEE
jgi:hypothetical protein